ncbi:galactose mutarotase-like protein [Parathielavia appendiculata]|uniref:Galactose mutarotase-like protein n=1 Tax=Parathielavia appendiculata TaxID=2587402 RepID=A0AAN6TVE0_9PEZI|nr:galactose mutarotase-like protein [Parathielavia appendiculata]
MRLAAAILAVLRSARAAADQNGKYWIYGEGIAAAFIPYGASISDLIVNDKYGIPRDIIMGFDNATYYSVDPVHPHLGGVPGRYANRIKNSTFTIDGDTYRVSANDNPTADHPSGLNTLHGGKDGWDWRDFDVVAHNNHSITFSIVDPDGKEGFPGEVISYITYTMGNMTWDAKMVAIATTKKTPIMLTSHAYWNLDGFSNNETNLVLNHSLHMPYSGQRVAVDNILIPTGKIAPNVKGSVNDFWSRPKQIGASFNNSKIHGNCGYNCTGYDNCWLVNRNSPYNWRADGAYVASVSSAWSGIRLDIYSDQAAFQMYSCNFQNGSFPLKTSQGVGRDASHVLAGEAAPADDEDSSYAGRFPRTVPKYGCLVLEVQDWIDGINHPEWGRMEKQVFGPGSDPYVLQVSHRFTVG